ncbi:MAG: NosD domain-containing protein [Candidatus Thorarchaeota archaeon]
MGKHTTTMLVIVLFFCAAASVALVGVDAGNDMTCARNAEMANQWTNADLTPHSPVVILSDADFASQGWPGSGTALDPYRIEGLDITSDYGIKIENTVSYFVISDCRTQTTDVGIRLRNVTHGSIIGCTFTGLSLDGLSAENSTLVNVTDCVFDQLSNGAWLSDSKNLTVARCEFTRIDHEGLGLVAVSYSQIVNNSFVGAPIGLHTFATIPVGLRMSLSLSNDVTGNVFTNTGILPDSCFASNSFQNNTVNGKPVGVLIGLSSVEIDASTYGQIFLDTCIDVSVNGGMFSGVPVGVFLSSCARCTISGAQVDRSVYAIRTISTVLCTVEAAAITNCDTALRDEWSAHLHVEGCSIENASIGITIQHTGSVVISNSSVSAITHTAISLDQVQDCVVFGTTVRHCTDGLGVVGAENVTISWGEIAFIANTALKVQDSTQLNVTKNQLFRNGDNMYFEKTGNSVVSKNCIYSGEGNGITLLRCTAFRITWNQVVNNTVGIELGILTQDCTVYGNVIAQNREQNANDGGNSNSWDNGVDTGNAWSDYPGQGTYSVPGSAGAVDHYPEGADTDHDGLTDYAEENTYGSDPFNPDTDGDGMLDGDEVAQGRNPTIPDASAQPGFIYVSVIAIGVSAVAVLLVMRKR